MLIHSDAGQRGRDVAVGNAWRGPGRTVCRERRHGANAVRCRRCRWPISTAHRPHSDRYTAAVVAGAPTYVSGPTEIGGEADRNIDQATKVGAGTFTPAHLEILGDPYRNGGSVNMFGVPAVGRRPLQQQRL